MTSPERWGVAPGYHDATGHWHEPQGDTVREVMAAMGARPGGGDGPPWQGPIMLRPGSPPLAPGVVHLEDGAAIEVGGPGPAPQLPFGYHRWEGEAGSRRLVVSPGACPLPARRQWGWAAQLYASRSARSWGIGDLGDLATLAEWSASLGAGFVLINPLHAAAPTGRQEASPYFAGSRCFANPLYLRIEDLPGAGELGAIESLAAQGRALNGGRLIDRDRAWALKSAALEELFARFEAEAAPDPAFEGYRRERGEVLEGYATWNALAEAHGVPWQTWPAALRHPAGAAVTAFAASGHGRRRVRYHAWLQWHLDRQLARAARTVPVVQDLAVGVSAGGPDAWLWQDELAAGIHVGAPPDSFNTRGQDWGLPPWIPHRLAGAGYEPFIQTIRAGLRHAGGVRVDHVMGLFRLFWIPEGRTPQDGAYVRYPHQDLLDIVALEATRAGAYVVGEDLGTVEPWVRETLAGAGVLSYRLWWFEPEPPAAWPAQALGAVTTHDLPTVASAWTGSDLAQQERLGLQPNRDGMAGMRRRLAEWTGSTEAAPVGEVVERTYAALAAAPCTLLAASLDDACEVEERPNYPGTTSQWPNWCLALPASLDELRELPLSRALAAALAARDGSGAAPPP